MGRYLAVRQTAAHKRVGHDFWWWYVLVRPGLKVLLVVGPPVVGVVALWRTVPHPVLGAGCAALAAGCAALLVGRQVSMAGTHARMMGTARSGVDVAVFLAGIALATLAVLIFRVG